MEVPLERRKCYYNENAVEINHEIIKNTCFECFIVINDSATSGHINSL